MKSEAISTPELEKLDEQIQKSQEVTKKLQEKRKKKEKEIAAKRGRARDKWMSSLCAELERILADRIGASYWETADTDEIALKIDDALSPQTDVSHIEEAEETEGRETGKLEGQEEERGETV